MSQNIMLIVVPKGRDMEDSQGQNPNYDCREVVIGVAEVAMATPKFQVLLYKMVLKRIS